MRGRELTNNFVGLVVIAILASFSVLYYLFEPHTLGVLLNSLYAGVMVAIGVTYYKILIDAWFNPDDFNRVRQMTLTIGGQWVVISLFIAVSIYANSITSPSVYAASLFGRYLASIVAIFQVTAPDYGDGLFYGADRKFLSFGIAAGLSVGAAICFVQGL